MKKGLRTFPGSKLPEPGIGEAAAYKAALEQKTGMSRAIARQILQQDTRLKLKPEELFMLKEGKGEPLDLMRRYYGDTGMAAYDDFLNKTQEYGLRYKGVKEAATDVLASVELIPKFASGGLARILEL